jgi:CIC family chloride channel protein
VFICRRHTARVTTERVRNPPPRLPRRLPSGRGATEQPNNTSEEAALTPRFWAALVVTGVLTGAFGMGLMALLYGVEDLAWGPRHPDFQSSVFRADGLHRFTALVVAALIGGVAWWLLRRWTRGSADIDDSIWSGDQLSPSRSLGTSVISEIVVGLGASLGREAAPKLMGGVAGDVLGRRLKLSPAQIRLLVACGGGAGLACVYNVPLGGSLFTAEVLIGAVSVPVLLPALACSGIATLVAWAYLTHGPTYTDVPSYHVSPALVIFAVIAGPIFGLLAVGYVRLIGMVSHHRASGAKIMPAMLVVFAVVGAIGIRYPQLFGNGKDMAHTVLLGGGTVGVLLVLAILKPLLTAACLGAGATGGLFTPTLSTGAVLGGGLGLLWSHVIGGTSPGAYALVGAAAFVGAGMLAPVSALVLVLELTHTGFSLLVPMIIATGLATFLVRYLDGYSIYSARLPARPSESMQA